MDRRTPYTLSVLAPSENGADESKTTVQARLRDFVLEFQVDNAFIYRYEMNRHREGQRVTNRLTVTEINYDKMY